MGVLDFDGEERGATTHARVRFVPLLKALGLPDWYGDLYGEYARIDPALDSWFSLDREHSRALYLASTVTGGAWGLSLELKDYDDFNFPTINNPPTLIREHEAFFLNRQTHTLLPDDETGIQAELTWALPRQVGLIAAWNLATRRGSRSGEEGKSLSEYFLQLDSPVGEAFHGQVFLDYARSRILQNERRTTAGTRWDWSGGTRYAVVADLQFQDVDRRFGSRRFPYENLPCRGRGHPLSGLDLVAAGTEVQRPAGDRGLPVWGDLLVGPGDELAVSRRPHGEPVRGETAHRARLHRGNLLRGAGIRRGGVTPDEQGAVAAGGGVRSRCKPRYRGSNPQALTDQNTAAGYLGPAIFPY